MQHLYETSIADNLLLNRVCDCASALCLKPMLTSYGSWSERFSLNLHATSVRDNHRQACTFYSCVWLCVCVVFKADGYKLRIVIRAVFAKPTYSTCTRKASPTNWLPIYCSDQFLFLYSREYNALINNIILFWCRIRNSTNLHQWRGHKVPFILKGMYVGCCRLLFCLLLVTVS